MNKRLWWLAGLGAGALMLLVGYLWIPKEWPSTNAPVSESEDPLPSTCSPQLVEQLVPRVLHAINTADRAKLAQYFGDDMEWYSAGGGRDPGFTKAVMPKELMDYLEKRHRHREKTELVDLNVHSWGSTEIDWNMKLRISADDLPVSPKEVPAKAEANCSTHRIIRWSVGS